ncbi:hypothetical protein CR203_15535 [Salipaludibacillus neizhouensis]|uniref:YfhO family protein n=1 Tax=Salipaludibacillus neizhouensis TaxID=885475 RepID=A0A3A9KFD8_9BACI|nr:YfhO family protein [Salipaludibacillus neizhouensis]RKL66305.1 hypothetical protein CR203_15535 [Salipaludibacillus neizhouensis]
MDKKRKLIGLLVSCFVVASLAHLFFLREWTQEQYMVGPNDGLQQMVTFKKLLYEQYTSGNFFYSYQFGLGGGTYSQLAFYFSTSVVFIITTAIVFLLESLHMVETPDIIFWAKATVFISLGRLTGILFITTLVFHYMKNNWLASFIGACAYGLTVIYFRHVTYWEFFADAMIWVPLLVLGVEKIIREARPSWFIFAVALTLFNNFYFAYVNLIFIVIYIVFRLVFGMGQNEKSRWELFLFSGVIGAGISAVAFVPAVYSYLNNYRPPYRFPIEMIKVSDNILFASSIIILPTVFLLFLFTYTFYKNQAFRVFAFISIVFILFHFSPLVASAFNGFSAPQYRWEYLLSFVVGGVVASGLQNLSKVSIKEMIIASVLMITTYLVFYNREDSLLISPWISIGTISLVSITMVLVISFTWIPTKKWKYLLYVIVLVNALVVANISQYVIFEAGGVNEVSKSHLLSDKYNGKEQRELLRKLKNRESDSLSRIDWKVDLLNNTPIVQDFNGMSVYSSIINKNLLFFYLYDLNIDMGRESVSRYATLGSRANLYSLFQGKYMIRNKDNTANIPYGFKEILRSENYVAYENSYVLPFATTKKQVYAMDDMEHATVLEKEHAMLEGVIVENVDIANAVKLEEIPNIIKEASVETVDATFKNNLLSVKEKTGGIDLVIDPLDSDTKDYYVSFHLESLAGRQGFALKVNDYRTTRKHNQSIYKTYVDDLTIRVAKAERVSIRVPKGEYILKDIELYQENYHSLETAHRNASAIEPVNWVGNKLTVTYDNEGNDRYMVLPIPFERGWELHINNKKQAVEKVNFTFLGFPIKEGMNQIKLVYYPPFFKVSFVVTILSGGLAFIVIRGKKNNAPAKLK